MRLAVKSGILLSVVCLLVSGCVGPNATTEVREASFKAHAAISVGMIPMEDYLLRHHTALMTGAEKPTLSLVADRWHFHSASAPAFGSATPVDSRGYFLTAAHCLDDGPVHLMYRETDVPRVEEGRVVWRGDRGSHPVDLAVVCVPSRLTYVFDWAREFKAGDDVFGVGPDYSDSDDRKETSLHTGCFAGKITRFSAPRQAITRYVQISHSAPVHHGDSGGPLVNEKGELLAIEVQQGVAWNGRPVGLPFFPRGYAYRPDADWLRKLIDDDFTQHSTSAITEPSRAPGEKPEPVTRRDTSP